MDLYAEDIAYRYTYQELHNLDDNIKFRVVFVDGEQYMTRRQIIFTWFCWGLFRFSPTAPIVKRLSLHKYLKANSYLDLSAKIFWHIYGHTEVKSHSFIWDLSAYFCEITNLIYNYVTGKLGAYVTTASLHDLMEVINYPDILKAKEEYMAIVSRKHVDDKTVKRAIHAAHAAISKVMYGNGHTLAGNGIKHMCEIEIINKGQLLQLIGPRGAVDDIDSIQFVTPIHTGYAEGMQNIYDLATDSRSASKALLNNVSPLQDSEYFNRRETMNGSFIREVTIGSCTNFITNAYLVKENDEVLLRGKYIMVDNKPVLIWDNFKEFIGTVVSIRAVTGCGNHDVTTVCSVCHGWQHLIIPPLDNVGYVSVTEILSKVSSIVLSTKHYTSSELNITVVLNDISSRWIRKTKRTDALYFTEYAVKHDIVMRIESKYVKYLTQILHINVEELPVDRITNIPVFSIGHMSADGNMLTPYENMRLDVSGSGVHLSVEALRYIRKHGWASNRGYVEIKLSHWALNDPVFILPRKGDDVQLFLKQVESFIKPEGATIAAITNHKTRGSAVSELVEILRERITALNMYQIEYIIRTCMTIDAPNGDYRLPTTDDPFVFSSLTKILKNRNLSVALAFQEQYSVIMDTHWHKPKTHTPHMFDHLVRGAKKD